MLAYWFGLQAVALFVALVFPTLLILVGVFNASARQALRRGPTDPITQLPTRDVLEAALDRSFALEAETGLRSGAMVLEIDEFEHYLTQYGELAAQKLLGTIAGRVSSALRELDTVARLDKSVFAIALSPARRADLESMIQIAARMQTAISEPLMLDGLRIYVTASVGFCVPKRASEKNGRFCIEAAEAALAEAQATGIAAIRAYSAQPKRKRVMRAGLVGEVHGALEGGQIKAWFQPQISTDTGHVSGAEALARWEHPDHGIILPGAFLPAISAAGLTDRLGEVILFNALSAMHEWVDAGLHVPSVGVNFSTDDLSDPKLPDRIRWELDRFELTPDRLCIEVLETVIASNSNDIIARNLAKLCEMGCKIDLDDFGTGHASIANIRRFYVNRIKIDRSFVTNVDRDRQQQQMLTAILEMASRLEIDTLAEGVENAGEHTLLAQLGCNHVQGYHIARPMTLRDTSLWLGKHSRDMPSGPEIPRKTGA
ncbi:Sensory box/GGDEF family protein [Candidatus Rhodobacter oscarellae]|uniref:Sensory box/GGDEF family protein n=1 Tax=Candidatus Rhodobacter oscarellae TaxID=1675527 RepID=A0A0J9GWQ3_9RHOB|nr:Sensory box/GGDEF family protein [Candidatus Rhodobacter lobularis]